MQKTAVPKPPASARAKRPPRIAQLINKAVVRLNVFIYRKSGGKILGRFGGVDALLITTVGRRSGKTRTNPAGYIWDRGRFIVCAAYGGESVHPAWFLNLGADPRATIEIGHQRIEVTAEVVPPGAERDRIWARMIEVLPLYTRFQNRTDRLLPVVLLSPVPETGRIT